MKGKPAPSFSPASPERSEPLLGLVLQIVLLDRPRQDRIGGSEHGSQEDRGPERQAEVPVTGERHAENRDRHDDADEPRHRAPARPRDRPPDADPHHDEAHDDGELGDPLEGGDPLERVLRGEVEEERAG